MDEIKTIAEHANIEEMETKLPNLAELERLAVLSEECAEVQQAIGKIIRHGYDNYHPNTPEIKNKQRLKEELLDLLLAIALVLHRDYDSDDLLVTDEDIEALMAKKEKYLHFNNFEGIEI